MLNIKFKATSNNFDLPIKGSDYASCWDVYAADIKQIDYNLYEVDLGFATEFPKEYKGVIVPRSSITKTDLVIQNSPCQIDSDYRGSWKVKFKVLPKKGTHYIGGKPQPIYEFPYNIGDRVAQIYFEKVEPISWKPVNKLTDSTRNTGGFGSTGK